MSIELLNQGLNLITEKSEVFFKGEMPLSFIEKAENILNVKFPNTYREFLLKKGCGNFKYKEFYGIVDEDFYNSSIPDAIWLTLDERKNSNLDLSLILIEQSDEGYYALDTSSMINEECKVVEWIPGLTLEKLEIVAPDFGTFFLNEILEVLE